MVKPEQAIHQVGTAYGVRARGDLVARTRQWKLREMSRAGVWHCHNVSRVRAFLEALV